MARKRLPEQIHQALSIASDYRVKPSGLGGYNVWKFRGWNQQHPGWRVILGNVLDPELFLLDRFGLLVPDEPRPSVPEPIRARIVWTAHGDWEPS